MSTARQIFEESADVLKNFSTEENFQLIEKAAELMIESIQNGGKIISCGNGGSMSDAMHLAEEMTGRFRDHRDALPAIAISDSSFITCVANDYGFDQVFARFIQGMGNENDVFVAISTSGNSPNIINAILAAKARGLKVIALTGKSGGEAGMMSDIEIRVPHFQYSDRIQEIHIKVIHSLIQIIEDKMFN